MATKGYVGVNGVARSLKQICVGVNGVARKVKKAYIGVNGVARLCYSGVNGAVISDGEIGRNISNGYVYNGYMWVYSFYTKTLYGVSLSGGATVEIPVSSTSVGFSEMVSPTIQPICLSILDGVLFLTQLRGPSSGLTAPTDANTTLLSAPFTGQETTISLVNVSSYPSGRGLVIGSYGRALPLVQKVAVSGVEKYYFFVGWTGDNSSGYYLYYWTWTTGEDLTCPNASLGSSMRLVMHAFSPKNSGEGIYINDYYSPSDSYKQLISIPRGTYTQTRTTFAEAGTTVLSSEIPVASPECVYVGGASNKRIGYVKKSFSYIVDISSQIDLPEEATSFYDAAVYCEGLDMWFMFVGTGFVYTTDLTDATKYEYVDTQSVLGTISRFGYVEYIEETGQLIVVGQDSAARVKVAVFDATSF